MKKFTFVLAATALCVNVGFAQTFKSLNCQKATNQIILKKSDKSVTEKMLSGATQFDFVKENQKRIAKAPAQAAALSAPQALPATDVTDYYFTANWNTAEGANYYEADVYRTFKTVNAVDYCPLYEDFYFAQASTSEVSKYLYDECYRWGWALFGGKIGDQSIILPKTSSQGQSQLITPYLDLTGGGATGTISFGIVAQGAVGDSIGVGFFYVDENDQEKVYSVGKIPFTSAEINAYYDISNFPFYEEEGFFLYTMGNTSDVTLNLFILSQPIAAGSEFSGFYDYRTTQSTSATFFTMEKDVETEGVTDEFWYGIFALKVNETSNQIEDASSISNFITVGETSGVEGVQVSNDKIFVHDNLHVVLERPAQVDVYNMAGVLVMSVEGVEGENEIALPASGAYIVKAGNTVAKVMK